MVVINYRLKDSLVKYVLLLLFTATLARWVHAFKEAALRHCGVVISRHKVLNSAVSLGNLEDQHCARGRLEVGQRVTDINKVFQEHSLVVVWFPLLSGRAVKLELNLRLANLLEG